MLFLMWFTTSVSAMLAFVYLLWSIGFIWPMRTEAELARAVVGTKGITRMPQAWPTALYVVFFMAAAIWPTYPSGVYHAPVLLGIALILLLRGVLSATGFIAKRYPEEPFVTLDRRVYGRLALVLGAAFAALWAAT